MTTTRAGCTVSLTGGWGHCPGCDETRKTSTVYYWAEINAHFGECAVCGSTFKVPGWERNVTHADEAKAAWIADEIDPCTPAEAHTMQLPDNPDAVVRRLVVRIVEARLRRRLN